MMSKKKIVLLVLNYNDYGTTEMFLKKVENYECISKIIVIDNKSENESLKVLNEYKSNKIDVICTDKNGGYAYGNNYGARYAQQKYKPEYIVISNPDVIVEEEVILKIVKQLDRSNNTAIGTCKMIEKNGQLNNRFAWKLPTYFDNIILCFPIMSKIFKPTMYRKDILNTKGHVYVDVVPGSFFIIKSNEFKKVNYFDENTFLFYEEEILAHKLIKNGLKSIVMTDLEFIHNHGVTIKKHYSSYISRYIILGKSKEVYLKDYLKVSNLKLNIFKIIFNFSKYEVKMIEFIKSLMRT